MAFHIAYTCGACFYQAMKELNEEGGIVARSNAISKTTVRWSTVCVR